MVVKMVMAHLITTYDIRLAVEDVNPSMSVGATMLPHPRLAFQMREQKHKPINE